MIERGAARGVQGRRNYGNYRYVQYFLFRIYTTREQDICVIPAKLHVLLFALLLDFTICC